MRKYQIYSDSSCDLTTSQLEQKYQIPFVVSFDGENYFKEKEEISVDEFYNKLDGVYPKTSVPSVQAFIDKFTPALENDEDIICVTISGELSSSFQSAKNAVSILLEDYPNSKIFIVDSRLATVPQGLIVKQMIKMREQGQDIHEVLEYIESVREKSSVVFTVGDISYLQKGGRIGSVVVKSAKALNLKPIVCLKDGKVSSIGVSRGEKSVIEKILTSLKEQIDDVKNYVFAVGYTDEESEKQANKLALEMKEAFSDIDFQQNFQIGTTIGAHTGKGTFGIAFARKNM